MIRQCYMEYRMRKSNHQSVHFHPRLLSSFPASGKSRKGREKDRTQNSLPKIFNSFYRPNWMFILVVVGIIIIVVVVVVVD